MYLLFVMGQKRLYLSLLLGLILCGGNSGCKTSSFSAQDGQQKDASQSKKKAVVNLSKEKEVKFTILPDPFDSSIPRDQQAFAEWGRSTALARYSSALSMEMNQQGESAFEEYVRAVNADPGNEWLLINVSRQLIEKGRLEDATTLLELSSKRKDASSTVFCWLALAKASSGDTQSAIKMAKKALHKPEAGALAYQTLFGIYVESKKTKEALKTLQQAEKEGRDSIPFLLDISHLYLNNRDKITELGLDPLKESARIVGEIEKLMASAKETDSDRPDHAEMLADTYRAMGEEEKALEQYEKLLEENPTLPRLKEKRANALFALERYEEAESEYRLLVRENPTELRYLPILGDICQKMGRYKEAGDFYYYAAVMERSNPDLFLLAASMRLAECNPRKALDALDLVRLSGYKSFRSEYLAGLAYGDLERYTDAINCFKAAEELDKSQESKLLGESFYLILAEFHERNGEKEKAFEIAENLLAQYPESPQCLNTLGYLWADNGLHLEKSLEMIQRALAAEPDAPAYLDSLAWVLYKMNRPEEALSHQLRVFGLVKETEHEHLIVYYDHLGDIYNSIGRKEEARSAWKSALESCQQLPYKKWIQSLSEKIKKKIES